MAKATARIAALYDAVYANPDDDGPRSVLADALQEAGDPRGEFIALQLARGRGGKKTRRESQLLKQTSGRTTGGKDLPNLRAWLGPLTMAIPNKGLVYERGFVAKCQLQHHRENIEPYLKHREWATVEEVTTGRWKGSMQALADALPSLRALTTEENAGLLPSHPTLEKIDVKFVFESKDHEHLATLKLPMLRELDIAWCYPTLTQMRPFLDAVTSLRILRLNAKDPGAWIPWIVKRKLEHARINATMNPWYMTFAGDQIRAEYWDGGHPHPDAQAAGELADHLDCVPSPKRWHVSIQRRALPIRGRLATTLKQFASHVVEVEPE